MNAKFRTGLTCIALLGMSAIAPEASATSGSNGLHDPSRMIESNGKVYVYSTEGGSISSSDGLVWADVARPAWDLSLLSANEGVWAPDGLYLNGQYLIYYALWSQGPKSSAVGLITSPTLDPSSPDYKWTDRGVVVSAPSGSTFSTIDPCPVLDADGNLWLSWGGGYPFNSADNSIWVTRLDNTTGLPLTSDPAYKPPAAPGHPLEAGHKEGSYLYYHSGYYYLFWQTGNGFDPGTSYQINMARATAITGPYTGDQVFYSKNPGTGIYGPGHMGIYNCGGVDRFTYHFYSNDTNSGSSLGENALSWSSDGWPVPGAVSTTPFAPCEQDAGAGGSTTEDSGGTAGGDDAASTVDASGGDDSSSSGAGSTGGSGGTPDGSDTGSSGGSSGATGTVDASVGDAGGSGAAGSGSGAAGGSSSGSGSDTASGSHSSGCSYAGGGRDSAYGATGLLLLVGMAVMGRRRR